MFVIVCVCVLSKFACVLVSFLFVVDLLLSISFITSCSSFFSFVRYLFPMQTSVKLDILWLNIQGIRDQIKRRSIFSFLKDSKTDIYFLQETYSELKDEIIWKNEWGAEIFFSHGTNHSKGVSILINPSLNCQVDYCYSNKSGRIVLITITLGSTL